MMLTYPITQQYVYALEQSDADGEVWRIIELCATDYEAIERADFLGATYPDGRFRIRRYMLDTKRPSHQAYGIGNIFIQVVAE